MSNAASYLPFDVGSLANFNAWGAALSAALDATGFTKTADTGQINFSTNVTAPSSSYVGFEIRQPASDPLQTGSTAYYIRVDYGSASNVTTPAIKLTLGTGTNGAGTLTGIVTTTQAVNAIAASGVGNVTSTYECDFYWDVSTLGAMLWRTLPIATAGWGIGIERTKNTDGTDSTDGVTLMVTSNQGKLAQTIVFGQSAGPALTVIPSIDTGGSTGTGTDGFNNNTPISPVFPCYGKWGNPSKVFASCRQADMVEGGLVSSTIYGSAITYLGSKVGKLPTLGAGGVQALLMRWA